MCKGKRAGAKEKTEQLDSQVRKETEEHGKHRVVLSEISRYMDELFLSCLDLRSSYRQC